MADNRVCEICCERPAKIVILRRRSLDEHRTLVCLECAAERARLYVDAGVDLGAVLARLDTRIKPARAVVGACEICGSTLAEIVADGRPGCCACYSRFKGEIERGIREAQGRTCHVGKALDR